MPLNALALVLTAALLHAIWNLAAKRASGQPHFALLSAVGVAVLWAPAAAWFGWQELPRWGTWEWALVGASAIVHLAYFQALLTGYRLADLTVVYPVARGSAPLVTALGATVLLGESLGLQGALGVLTVCGGVFLVAGGPALWHAPQRHRVLAGLRWGGLTGLLIAGYSLIDGYAVKVLLVGPVLLDYLGNVLRVPFLLPAAWRDRKGLRLCLRTQWRAALLVATLGPAAYIGVLYAVRLAPLSHVAPAREVSMLFAAVLGGRLLAEDAQGWRLAGAAAIAAGVGLLAWH